MSKPVLIIDTREQLPYQFKAFEDQFEHTIRGTLKAGDYSLEGYQGRIAVERKSLGDLVNTIVHGRERFKRELTKLSAMDYAAIVVEASLKEVSSPYSFSQAKPQSVVGSLQSFSLLYGVHIVFANDRHNAESWIANTLLKFYRYIESADVQS